MRKDTNSAYRARARATEAMIDAAVGEIAAEQSATWAARKAQAAESEATRHVFTRDEVAGAVMVRDRFGWHRVVRANAKSVTVETGYSWTDRIGVSKVLEVRS